MKSLGWMNGDKLKGSKKKKRTIWDKFEVATIEDKMPETRLRWLGNVQRRPIDATVRKLIV